jgi:transcriptional regulator GlxA family with amidase domain
LSLVDRAKAAMAARCGEPIVLGELAGTLGVAERTLFRHFKAETGETPNGFLQRMRLERARRLLETTTRSFATITIEAGYQDEATFRKLFKAEVGLTPAEYRRRFALKTEAV